MLDDFQSKIEKNKVYFKPSEGFAFQGVSISQIKSLKLKDGKTIIKDEYEKIRTILDYKNLSIEDKAIYDAKRDSKKWLAYPPLGLISAGGLGTATFFIVEDIFDMSDESILFPSIFAGSLGAVGFYYLFDKRNFEVIKTGDDYLYEKLYSEEYKKRKIKNIITSSGVVGATALIGAWITLSSIDMSGYDACFDPRCD